MQFLSIILVAAAALSCLATAANGDVPQDPLVPFNDLLPPLLDDATKGSDVKVATTTTRKPTTVAHATLFKPTKKSYYQQQTQHIKELHLIDDQAVVPHDYKEQQQHLQHLHETQQKQQQQPQQLLQQKLQQKVQQQRSQQYQLEKKLQQQQKQQQQPKAQASQQQHVAQRPAAQQAPQPHVYKHASVRPQSQHRFQQPQAYRQAGAQQYVDYFQQTTHRPPKAGLPTLTPFPRHLK